MRGEYAGNRCQHLGCVREAQSFGLCGAHYMRRKRGTAMDKPVRAQRSRTLSERLRDAAVEYANAETEQDFNNSWARLRQAAKDYTFGEAS